MGKRAIEWVHRGVCESTPKSYIGLLFDSLHTLEAKASPLHMSMKQLQKPESGLITPISCSSRDIATHTRAAVCFAADHVTSREA